MENGSPPGDVPAHDSSRPARGADTEIGISQLMRALDVDAAAAQVYLDLATRGGSAELTELVHLAHVSGLVEPAVPGVPGGSRADGRAWVEARVADLEDAGAVVRTDDGVRLRPPRLAFQQRVEAHLEQAHLAQEAGRWVADLSLRHSSAPDVEQITDALAVPDTLKRLQDGAVADVVALSVGSAPSRHPVSIAPGTLDALARGVDYRVVYGAEVLKNHAVMAVVQQCVDAGEQARVFPGIEMNLVIADGRVGFLMYPGPGLERRAVVIHPSGLLDAMRSTVESYWRISVPLTATQASEDAASPSDEHRQLLTYLSAGLTDEAIGRELNVSERTIARRVARLQEMLGARGRFQLGVQAIRRGWL